MFPFIDQHHLAKITFHCLLLLLAWFGSLRIVEGVHVDFQIGQAGCLKVTLRALYSWLPGDVLVGVVCDGLVLEEGLGLGAP